MTSPVIVYANVAETLAYPIDAVWRPIAAFGGLQHWAAGISDCAVDGVGVGAIRTVSRNGSQVRERLEAIDHAAYVLRYLILPPHPMPADNVHGNIALRAIDDQTTEMIWRSDATNFRIEPALLGERIAHFYRASIAGLRTLLDAG